MKRHAAVVLKAKPDASGQDLVNYSRATKRVRKALRQGWKSVRTLAKDAAP
jgi:hypothetical protein